jgi:hypothetical protein
VIETIVFPDAVEIVCDHLRSELPDHGYTAIQVVSAVPTTRPAMFVRVDRVGGVRRNLVTDEPTLTVETWAATDQAAHDLSQICRALLYAMPGGGSVYRVTEFSGPARLPDPLSDSPRYSFTAAVAVVGAAV